MLSMRLRAQVSALTERVARLKANAQAKLTEISDANQQLAKALEQRTSALTALQKKAHDAEAGKAALESSIAADRVGASIALRELSHADGELKAAGAASTLLSARPRVVLSPCAWGGPLRAAREPLPCRLAQYHAPSTWQWRRITRRATWSAGCVRGWRGCKPSRRA